MDGIDVANHDEDHCILIEFIYSLTFSVESVFTTKKQNSCLTIKKTEKNQLVSSSDRFGGAIFFVFFARRLVLFATSSTSFINWVLFLVRFLFFG